MPNIKLLWLSDIHLNFLDDDERGLFYQELVVESANGIIITGDIAEAPSICDILLEMVEAVSLPVYFVLGNHDYYRGNVSGVTEEVDGLCRRVNNLFWLNKLDVIQLCDDTVMIGQDGWADGRYGDYDHSFVVLNDSRFIGDLRQADLVSQRELQMKMQELADKDAEALEQSLIKAVSNNYKRIIIATHVPPFTEACRYEGKLSDENWTPFFASKVTGDVIRQYATSHPEIEFLVLCGHTHTETEITLSENLCVKVAGAEYRKPRIQECILL